MSFLWFLGFCRRLLWIGAIIAVLPFLVACGDDDTDKALVGRWPISAESFDHWIDAGVVVPHIPYLIVRPDGTFSLHRLQPDCVLHDKNGRLRKTADEPAVKYDADCLANAEAAKKEGLGVHHAVSAEGTWRIMENGMVHFQVSKAAAIPVNFTKRVRGYLADVPKYIRSIEGGITNKAALRLVALGLNLHKERFHRFLTTFFVMDGKPASYAIKEDRLYLASMGDKWRQVYRRDDNREATNAITLLVGLELLRVGQYFRCLTNRLRKSDDKTNQQLKSLLALIKKGLSMNSEIERLMLAQRANPTDGRAKKMRRLGRETNEFLDKLAENAIVVRAGRSNFGAFLGCPDRDKYP